jgi:hypothetical protein
MMTPESLPYKVSPETSSARTYLFLALILPIFAVAPLFYPGYMETHTGLAPLWNVADLRANPGDPGWLPHIAHSFDPLRSDGLLVYYLAALLPFDVVVATKLVGGLGWVLGSLGMVLWLRSWLGSPGALAAALVYTYLPFHIAAVYVRGAWGEAFFWGLLPWAMLAATYLVTTRRVIVWPLAAFFWLMLGLSQLGLTLWAFIFLMLLVLVIHRRQSLPPILSALAGLGLAFGLYLSLAPFSATSPVPFFDHFLFPFQLVSAYWGFGPSRPGWADGLSFQLGLAAVGLAMVSVALWPHTRSPEPNSVRPDRRLLFFLIAVIGLVLLQFSPAAWVWQLPGLATFSLSSTLTYPWQLLGLAGLGLAVLAGSVLGLDARLTELPLFGSIIMLIILSSYHYLAPQFIQVDHYLAGGPKAQWGAARLLLLDYDFSVQTSANTAALELGDTTLPLTVHGPLRAHDRLLLEATWQPLQTLDQDLKVFVHLVDANNNVLAQYDGRPRSGDYPTSQWVPGELIRDTYPILIPENAPPPPYRVFIGLYDETTSIRLPVPTDPEGRVILDVDQKS